MATQELAAGKKKNWLIGGAAASYRNSKEINKCVVVVNNSQSAKQCKAKRSTPKNKTTRREGGIEMPSSRLPSIMPVRQVGKTRVQNGGAESGGEKRLYGRIGSQTPRDLSECMPHSYVI